LNLIDRAEIKIIICRTNPDLATSRFTNRFLNNPDREKYHGDQSISLLKEKFKALTESYQPVNIDAQTLQVDTTDNYNPNSDGIINFIRQKNGR
jgi:hypothetical protein